MPPEAPPLNDQVRKVLIYRLGSLGDTVVALPCLRLIARTFPRAERRLLTNFPVQSKAPASAAVLVDTDLVHGYMRYTVGTRNPIELLRLAWEIRRFRPDVLIYMSHVRPWKAVLRDRFFFRMAGVRRIVGIGREEDMRPRPARDGFFETEAARIARLISEIGDAKVEDLSNWNLALTSDERQTASYALAPLGSRPLIVCGPGTKMQAKDWGADNWRALLACLSTEYAGHGLAMIGAREETDLSDLVSVDWNGPKVNLCGLLTPRETAAVLERAQVFLGPDSGPMHLAASVRTPCVIAFSAAGTPGSWFPAGPGHRVVYHRTSCHTCQLQTCTVEGRRCLTSISIDEMAVAVGQVMSGSHTNKNHPLEIASQPNAETPMAGPPGAIDELKPTPSRIVSSEAPATGRPMHVLLIADYEPDGVVSMRNYAAWLERMLSARGDSVTVIRPRPLFSRLASHPGLKRYLGYIDKYLIFPATVRSSLDGHDFIHIVDHSNSIYLSLVRGKANLITCHDLLAIRAARGEIPESPRGWTGKLQQRWILSGLKGAQHVLCVSTKTADDLKRLAGTHGSALRIIHHAVHWNGGPVAEFSPDLVSRLGLNAGQPYLLHVGSNDWYKNRPGVLRIFARLVQLEKFANFRLVMAGKPFAPEMLDVIGEEALGDRVIEALGVSDEELKVLYSNAQALLFPSLQEGFGWPILEAQALGCPVITTGRPPMTEVAGDAALFIDPADPQAAALAIAAGFDRRASLREAGFRNLKRFDETTVADKYIEFYEEILRTNEAVTR